MGVLCLAVKMLFMFQTCSYSSKYSQLWKQHCKYVVCTVLKVYSCVITVEMNHKFHHSKLTNKICVEKIGNVYLKQILQELIYRIFYVEAVGLQSHFMW